MYWFMGFPSKSFPALPISLQNPANYLFSAQNLGMVKSKRFLEGEYILSSALGNGENGISRLVEQHYLSESLSLISLSTPARISLLRPPEWMFNYDDGRASFYTPQNNFYWIGIRVWVPFLLHGTGSSY